MLHEIHSQSADIVDVLVDANDGRPPVIFPYWRRGKAAVCVVLHEGVCHAVLVFGPRGQRARRSRQVMYRARHITRIWFCDIDIEAIVQHTDARPEWFQ